MTKFTNSPEQLGYKVGAVPMTVPAGSTDGLENVLSVQGQPYALLRAWQAATLSYISLGVDAGGSLLTAGGGVGSTLVQATLLASTAMVGHVVIDTMPSVATSTAVDATLTSLGSTRLVGRVDVNNPTTSVTITNPTTVVDVNNPTTAVTITNPTTAVDATLTSAGSTRLVGRVEVNTPTTAVTITNPTTSVTVTNPTTSVTITNATTSVDASLTSVGSTRVVGTVNVTSGTILGPSTAATGQISSGTQTIGTVVVTSGAILGAGSSANTIGSVALVAGTSANTVGAVAVVAGTSGTLLGAVAVTSGVVLGAGSSANVLGSVTIASGTTAITLGSVALLAGTSANIVGTVALANGTTANSLGSVALLAGTTANTIGSVALVAGSSANTIGAVVQGPGSTANYWTLNSLPFSSAGIARTSVSTTVDISVIAANSSRKALVIANGSTTQIVALGLSTGAVTTGLANVNLYLQPTSQLHFGLGGDLPLFTGPIRGINITSTTVAGGVFVSEFT